MMVPSLLLICFFVAVVTASHELPAEVYWNKILPNTPMPGAIRDFLQPAKITERAINGSYGAVLETDILPGTKVTMHFMRTTAGFGPTFLSRQAATSIPFSSTNLQTIFSQLSLNPNSKEAEAIKKTLEECEMHPAYGETKFCATSLESMVEYTTKSLGTRDVSAISTVISKESAPRQQYTIVPSGVKKLPGSNFVACHARKYPYVVFYCHTTEGIAVYEAKLLGEDGTTAEAVAVCHTKIAGPDSGSYLKGLKIKPGTVPICHFLPQDHVVWGLNK